MNPQPSTPAPTDPLPPDKQIEKYAMGLGNKLRVASRGGKEDADYAALLKADQDFLDKQRSDIKAIADTYEKGYIDLKSRFDVIVTYAIAQEKGLREQLIRLLGWKGGSAPQPSVPPTPQPCPPEPKPECPPKVQGHEHGHHHGHHHHHHHHAQYPGQQGPVQSGTTPPPMDPFPPQIKDMQEKVRQLVSDLQDYYQAVYGQGKAADTALTTLMDFDGTKHQPDLSKVDLESVKAAAKTWDDKLKAWQGLRDLVDKNRQAEAFDVAYIYVLFLISKFGTQTSDLDLSQPADASDPTPTGWADASAWLLPPAASSPALPAVVGEAATPPQVPLYIPIRSDELMLLIEWKLLTVLGDLDTIRDAKNAANRAQTDLDDATKALADLKKSGIDRILQSLTPLPKPKS